MVGVLPEAETGKDSIAPIDRSVAVAAMLGLVILGKGEEAMFFEVVSKVVEIRRL